MNLFEVAVPPGVFRLGTELRSSNKWWDSNLVRWVEGVLQPIGGWTPLPESNVSPVPAQVSGMARAAHAWRSNNNQPYLAIGTHTGLYLYTGSELFDITPAGLAPGRIDTLSFSGYGVGPYGRGPYGTIRPTAGATELATTWSLDNFGEHLLAIHSDDGRLMAWTGDPSVKAAPVVATTGAVPLNNRFVLVTEERFAMVFGADGDPRKIRWSEKEDYTQWAIDATTSAGFLNVQSPGVLRAATRVRKQVLALTNTDAHVLDYVGYPAYYGLTRAGSSAGAFGSQVLAAADDVGYWAGAGNFYRFDGAVQVLPCTVRDYVFSDINSQQVEKAQAIRLPGLNEVMWLYPSASSMENDRYLIHNYLMGTWVIGKLARTTGEHMGVFPYPIYVDAQGRLWAHETGRNYGGAVPYIESGPVEMDNAGKVFDIVGILPDERVSGQVQVRFRTRYWPNGPVTERGPYSLAPYTYTALRFSGREISIRIESAGANDWRIGRFRFDHVLRGTR